MANKQTHLSSQYYDICIRRARGHCSVCYDPVIPGTGDTEAGSFGISAGSAAPAQTSAVGAKCTGITDLTVVTATSATTALLRLATFQGRGDYLEITNLQEATGTATTINPTVSRICGTFWNAKAASDQTTHATACTFSYPFLVGVHFDDDEGFAKDDDAAASLDKVENGKVGETGSGRGFQGFYINYWQNSCS